MKNAFWATLAIGFLLTGCAGENSANKNFTQEFKDGFVASCSKQAIGMKKSEAAEYCACALEQVMLNWDNDAEAEAGLNGMHMMEVQRLLVTPCMGK